MFSVASRFRLRHSRALSRFFSNRLSFLSLSWSPSFRLVRLFGAGRLLPEDMGEVGEADDVRSKSGGDAERARFNDEGLLMLGASCMAPTP
jgi:hypothetical protein